MTYYCPALDPPLDGSGRKTTTLVRDLEYFIHTKFHQNPSSGSGEEVENVNSLTDDGRTTDDWRTTDGRRTTRDHNMSLEPIGSCALKSIYFFLLIMSQPAGRFSNFFAQCRHISFLKLWYFRPNVQLKSDIFGRKFWIVLTEPCTCTLSSTKQISMWSVLMLCKTLY